MKCGFKRIEITWIEIVVDKQKIRRKVEATKPFVDLVVMNIGHDLFGAVATSANLKVAEVCTLVDQPPKLNIAALYMVDAHNS